MRKAAPLRSGPRSFSHLPKISATQRRNGAKLPSRATKRRREKCQLGETVPLIRPTDGNGFTHRLWH